jgi:MoaA/NifB/PqqE/SkfB family radical SAM enzyme
MRGEATECPTGHKHLLREIDDPLAFFRAKHKEHGELGLADDGPVYSLIAADTTHNCNLRCNFCFDDFSLATRERMTEENFLKLISMAELVGNGGLFLSCLYEPFLHPRFTNLLGLVPLIGKEKCFFTTNLSVKVFKPEVFEALANANLNYINISVDSMTRETYEKFRVNADYDVFWANLKNLADTFQRAPAPPQLRFISMAFCSNYAELLDVIRISHERFGVTQHEVRLPFVMPFAPPDWAQQESLTPEQWAALENKIAALPYPSKVMPTGTTARYYPAPVPGLFA